MPGGTRALPPLLRRAGVNRREAEVLEALAGRLQNREIAGRLFISVRTVEGHISSLLAKLHAADRNELATIARSQIVGPASSARLPLSLLELTERGPFIGREDEFALLRDRWAEAASGRRRVVLIMGEAGIGKSRLVAETALAADRDGAIVLLGHCDEALAPYQPIVEAATALIEALPEEVVAGAVRGMGMELFRLLPGLARFLTRVPVSDVGSSDAARFRLFEGVAGFVTVASQDTPMLLALEDLHWADPPTLQLVKHIVRRADRTRLLVLGTVRGTRLDRHLLKVAEDLRREHGADLIPLHGLSVAEIDALIGGRGTRVADLEPDDRQRLAKHLQRDTGGNPFFVGEVLRHLESQPLSRRDGTFPLAVPQTVRDVIVRRIEGLSNLTRHVLAVAAVAGRRFRIDLVARAAECSGDRTVTALEEAQSCGLVGDTIDRPGWLEFSHALVRETLERELPAGHRLRLHRLIGEILEAEDPTGHLAELAHHFHAAATSTDYERAVSYAVAAAKEATAKLAHEPAAELYEKALEALALAPAADRPRQFDLLILQAEVFRRGGVHSSARRAAMRALDLARELDDPDRLADAALAVGDCAPVWSTDQELIDVLTVALSRVDKHDLQRRARLLARLAQAEYYSVPPVVAAT